MTGTPRCRNANALHSPITPPPMTTTGCMVMKFLFLFLYEAQSSAGIRGARRVQRAVELTQRLPLPPVLIEVLRRQPSLEVGAQARPLMVQDGEPGRVPVVALDDDVLVEGAFIEEAEALGSQARASVGRVALP